MDSIRKYLRNVLITEAAASVSEAQGKGFALKKVYAGADTIFLLYDPNFYLDQLKNWKKKRKIQEFNVDTAFQSSSGIVGMVAIRYTNEDDGNCYGALVIQASAAEKGYGPLMYDIALSLSPSSTLIPDRNSVSKQASGVWKYYLNNRSDVEKNKLDDINNPKTPPEEDDCEIYGDKNRPELDYAYTINSSPSLGPLFTNHEKLLSDLEKLVEDDYSHIVEEALKKAAIELFQSKYKG